MTSLLRKHPLRILIADPEALIRDALAKLLESGGHTVLMAETGSQQAVVEAAERLQPELLLLESALVEGDPAALIARLGRPPASCRVILLSSLVDDQTVLDALAAGAAGFVLRSTTGSQLLDLLGASNDGGPALSAALTHRLLRGLAARSGSRSAAADDRLTARERQVLSQLVQGHSSSRSLASQLAISEKTAKFHVRNILDKLHVNSRAQAVAHAMRAGLVPYHGLGAASGEAATRVAAAAAGAG